MISFFAACLPAGADFRLAITSFLLSKTDFQSILSPGPDQRRPLGSISLVFVSTRPKQRARKIVQEAKKTKRIGCSKIRPKNAFSVLLIVILRSG